MAGRKDFFKTIDDITGKETLAQACTTATSGVSQIVATDPTTGLIDQSLLPSQLSGADGYACFPIWAEESGGLANGSTQWSYGNGAVGVIGVVLPFDAEAFAMSFDSDTSGTSVSIDLLSSGTAVATGQFTGQTDFFTLPGGVSFPAGARVGFRTNTEVGTYADARVAVWFRKPVTAALGDFVTRNEVYDEAATEDVPQINDNVANQVYLSNTFNLPEAGDYIVSANFTYSHDSSTNDFIGNLNIAGTDTQVVRHEPQDSAGIGIVVENQADNINETTGTDQRFTVYKEVVLRGQAAGDLPVNINWNTSANGVESSIYNAVIRVKRLTF